MAQKKPVKHGSRRILERPREKNEAAVSVPFTKVVGAGNDFVLVDNRSGLLQQRVGQFAVDVCDRRQGVGADGLILLEECNDADFRMRIFNPDGREAEMCGNGARCAALYAHANHIAGKTMTLATIAGEIEARISTGGVILMMGAPCDMVLGRKISNDKDVLEVHSINTGVPHAIVFVDNLEKTAVVDLGRFLRHHSKFGAKGTNVDFVSLHDKDAIRVRTYERGVENETPACGTGIVASALIASAVRGYKSPVYVHSRSGEQLVVTFEKDSPFADVRLEGSARLVFKGVVEKIA